MSLNHRIFITYPILLSDEILSVISQANFLKDHKITTGWSFIKSAPEKNFSAGIIYAHGVVLSVCRNVAGFRSDLMIHMHICMQYFVFNLKLEEWDMVLNGSKMVPLSMSPAAEASFFKTREGANFTPRLEQSQIQHWCRRQLRA
jgi:hypothetical protein